MNKIPILMYHSISDDQENASQPYFHINTSPIVFAEQMRFLYENDYIVIDLCEIDRYFKEDDKLPGKLAVITFDDGYQDFYTNAFPILEKFRFPATVFLPTDFIGKENKGLRGKIHLTWNQVSYLSDSGISFGSHTVTHPKLSGLHNDDVEYEIRESKKAIEKYLGRTIKTFSYPYKFPAGKKALIKHLGIILRKYEYHLGVSTIIGTTAKRDDIYCMKRIPVNSGDDISLFKAKLEGGYDWLGKPQYLYKILKSTLDA